MDTKHGGQTAKAPCHRASADVFLGAEKRVKWISLFLSEVGKWDKLRGIWSQERWKGTYLLMEVMDVLPVAQVRVSLLRSQSFPRAPLKQTRHSSLIHCACLEGHCFFSNSLVSGLLSTLQNFPGPQNNSCLCGLYLYLLNVLEIEAGTLLQQEDTRVHNPLPSER